MEEKIIKLELFIIVPTVAKEPRGWYNLQKQNLKEQNQIVVKQGLQKQKTKLVNLC